MFRIVYEKRVLKDLNKIPGPDVEKILSALKELSFDPTPIGSKKLTGREPLYRIRQGDYRIVYTIAYVEREVKVILVAHRKEAYRRL